jgi:hypothetical protein
MTTSEMLQSRPWCVLRNLVHAVYREARHLGPAGDVEARVTVSVGPWVVAAKKCRSERAKLKSRDLYELTADARSVADVLRPYKESTCLSLDDLINVFSLPDWKPGYGGRKWKEIGETLRDLISALEVEDIARAHEITGKVLLLRHNSGRLVPSRREWEKEKYLREKWPQLCD